jgi:hypothetical protein
MLHCHVQKVPRAGDEDSTFPPDQGGFDDPQVLAGIARLIEEAEAELAAARYERPE